MCPQNGALSAAPYVVQLVTSTVGSFIADTLRERGVLTTTTVRRSWQAVCESQISELGGKMGQIGPTWVNRQIRDFFR